MSRGENLETFILLPLTKYKNLEDRSKRIAEDKINATPSLPASPLPPSSEHQEHSESAEKEEEENLSKHKEKSIKLGKNLVTSYRKNQIKKILNLLKDVDGSEDIFRLNNLDALITNALSQSKKPLANEKEFYEFLFHNGLAHLCRNRSQIAKHYKRNWASIY